MTSKQKEYFFLLISKKLDEVRRRYALRHAGLADLSAKTVGDLVDEASRTYALSMECLLEDHELLEYKNLEEAQRRIGSGEFGCCRICGESIEVARLLKVPETSMCRSCSEDNERRHGENSHKRTDQKGGASWHRS